MIEPLIRGYLKTDLNRLLSIVIVFFKAQHIMDYKDLRRSTKDNYDALLARVARLAPGEYFEEGNVFYVRATSVGSRDLYYMCPFCFTNHKKNGEPYKNAKRVEHHHGSNGDTSNHFISRCPHCTSERSRIMMEGKSLCIGITDETVRL